MGFCGESARNCSMMRASNTEKKVMRCAETFELYEFRVTIAQHCKPQTRLAPAVCERVIKAIRSSRKKSIKIAQHAGRCTPDKVGRRIFSRRKWHREKTTFAM